MRARLLLSGICAGTLLLALAQPALAETPGAWLEVDDDEDAVDFGAEDGTGEAATSSDSDSCTWRRLEPDVEEYPSLGRGENADYDWYVKECVAADGTVTSQMVAVLRDPPAADPVALREQAVDRLALPQPQGELNPPDDQVVHLESWLWIASTIWTSLSRSVTAGGVTVTVTATPTRVLWDMGNGDVVVCDGPGTPYETSRPAEEQATDCSYTYRHTSAGQPGDAYQVTATVEWDASWTVTGAAGGGALPAMATSSVTAVRVAEMQALNQ